MANVANNETKDLQPTKVLPKGLGALPAEMKSKLKVVDPMAEIPCVVPNKPGFEKGTTLAGTYLRTNRIYSNKFTAGKVDAQGKYRDQHIFRDANGNLFGIWSVGILGYAMTKIQAGTFIAITYKGIAAKALRVGQSPSHEFDIAGVDLDLSGQANANAND